MSAWFSRVRAPKAQTEESKRIEIPGNLWIKCPGCAAMVYKNELEQNLNVCSKCNHHFRLGAKQRIDLLCDLHSFQELDSDLKTNDPLNFKDHQKYRERLRRAEKKNGAGSESVIIGRAKIGGQKVSIGVFNFFFMGGSMGIVAGEKLTRIVELAIEESTPVIIVSASGGARMQEGILSLMQMAKVTNALTRLSEKKLPYISILTDPTTGGVAASFAMLGDVIVTEPGALIGFAGPRVIEQTIRRKLPEGFQRSEFLLEHGMVDCIVSRPELKERIENILEILVPE